jgi:DNA-binding SARP family transcriptional activator
VLTIGILGSVEVAGAARLCGIKPKALLVTLVMCANECVSVERLVRVLWDGEPPRSAIANLRSYACGLRTALEPAGATVVFEAGGYRLRVAPERCDHLTFGRLASAGGAACARGEAAVAVDLLTRALALWRGSGAAAGVPRHGPLGCWLDSLDEERLRAVEDLAEARLATGTPRDAARDLAGVLAVAPLRVRAWQLRMLAHHRLGEHDLVDAVFQDARQAFGAELGLDPDPDLTRTHRSLLRWNATTRGPAPVQLAPSPVRLVGRDATVNAVVDAVRAREIGRGPYVVVADGPVGVGTSAMALRAAHELADDFPDGLLYMDLGDVGADDPDPVARVLGRLSRLLRPHEPAVDAIEAAAVVQRFTADRRLLVVADNVAVAAHVRPLMAVGTGCCLLAASVSPLGMVDADRRVHLAPLADAEAVGLLAELLDPDRSSRSDLDRLARACAGLPLALRIAAARLIDQPGLPVGVLVDRVLDDRRALAEMVTDGLSLRSRLGAALRAVDGCVRSALPCLVAPGALDMADIAHRLGPTGPACQTVLDQLSRIHFVVPVGRDRFRLPRFVRLLATELAAGDAPRREPSSAVEGHAVTGRYTEQQPENCQ